MSAKALRLNIAEEFFLSGSSTIRLTGSIDLSGDSEKDKLEAIGKGNREYSQNVIAAI